MISAELRKKAAQLRKQQPVAKTLKTAQVLEALSGLERLKRKIYG
jgi:hypothetical protein